MAAAFVAVAGAGAGLHAALSEKSPPLVAARPPSTSTQPPIAEPAPPRVAPPRSAPSTSASAVPPVSPEVALSPPRSRAAQLDDERALLDDARSALAEGDARGALDRLARHERTYARPLLGEERDALVVEALVRAGRYDEARARAAAFRRRTPRSLFSAAVDAAMESIP